MTMGIAIASLIISLWSITIIYSLFFFQFSFSSPFSYVLMAFQTYFFTGLFITAHDAMHGSISRNPKVNKYFGSVSAALYACLSWKRLLKNHFTHHKYPGTEQDPDFSSVSQNVFVWWLTFLKRYSSVYQLLCMALIYNILNIFVPEINLIFLWVIPAFLSSFQLFFFGTYQPHKTPHTHNMHPHNARSQKKNFLWGLLTCYFFGFHFEHHASPGTPWWKLYNFKQKS